MHLKNYITFNVQIDVIIEPATIADIINDRP
jgi:hypothetical protein